MSSALGIIVPGSGSNGFLTSSIGGDVNSTTAPLTPVLLMASCPGLTFCVSQDGTKFASLDSSFNLWILDMTQTTPAWVEALTASAIGTTLNQLTMSLDGTMIYATATNNKVLSILFASPHTVSVLAGSGTLATTNGTGAAAAFYAPFMIDIDPSGTFLVVSQNNFHDGTDGNWYFRKIIISTGVVTTCTTDFTNRLYQNPGVCRIGRSGTIYFTNSTSVNVSKIGPSGGPSDLITTAGHFLGAWTIDSAAPGEVNCYWSDDLYGNSLVRSKIATLAANPSSPGIDINPLTTLTGSPCPTGGQAMLAQMHFRQNVLQGALYIIDTALNLWTIHD